MIYSNGNILQDDGSYLMHINMDIHRDYRKPLHLDSNFSSLNPFKMGQFFRSILTNLVKQSSAAHTCKTNTLGDYSVVLMLALDSTNISNNQYIE